MAFAKQPGNVPDVISISNALTQLQCLGIEKPMIVTDNGYYSQNNMTEFARKNMKFLMLIDPNVKWVREIVDSLRDNVMRTSSICPFDRHIHGSSTMIMHNLSFVRKRTRGGIAAGDEEHFTRRLYVHVFYSLDNYGKKKEALERALFELKEQLEEGKDDFTDSALRKIQKFCIVKKTGRGGRLKVEFNEQAIAEECRYYGFFALVGNQPIETFVALMYYRQRERIEDTFSLQKGSLGGRRPRTWYPDIFKGRLFVQFVALGYLCFLRRRLKEVHDELAQNHGKAQLELKLVRWLEDHSVAQILDWFDCIETRSVKTPSSIVRWSTESIARDQLLLKRLGVLKESCTL